MSRKAQSLAEQLAATAPRARRGWEFPPAAKRDIDACIAANKAGSYISATRLARALKARYDLPASLGTIRMRLAEMNGGTW